MNLRDIHFDPLPDWPTWCVGASLAFLLLAWLAWHNTARIALMATLPLTALRLAAVLVLLLILLRPQHREELPVIKRDTVIVAGIDTSASMEQTDAGNRRRIDAATRLISDAKLDDPRFKLRLMTFDEDARPITPDKLPTLKAQGADTRLHTSITTMLQQASGGSKQDQTLILFTDGHDFEMVSPTRTGLAARAHNVTIHAVPFGALGQVRDVAVRMTGYQPFCYLKQKCRITAIARVSGCEHEFITAQLLRDGKVVESRQVATREEAELPLDFTVTESEAGQVEYEVRVLPVYRETETSNNSAITYLNVLDDKLRVLLIEGSPYWDTTFLQRTLMRNDKMDCDALIQIEPKTLRRVRKSEGGPPLELPSTKADFAAYDVVLLGSNVGSVLNEKAQAGLVDYVREGGGAVVCVRGPTGLADSAAAVLEPVVWEPGSATSGELQPSREGRVGGPLALLNGFAQDTRQLPFLTSGYIIKEKRDLAATLAETRVAGSDKARPALIHRPVGRGQVLAFGAGDLWRWAFASEVAAREAVFDRLWDQIIVWLMAGGDRVPGSKMRLRSSTATLPLGEAVHFRLQLKQGAHVDKPPVIELRGESSSPPERITMQVEGDTTHFEASHVPAGPGRYQAQVTLPDGQTQSARFMVFQENRERTEVAADRTYLKKLCEATGGQLVEPAQFPRFVETLKAGLQPSERRFREVPLWDRPALLALIVALLAMEWYFRRRLGLS